MSAALDRIVEVYRARLLAEGERTADEVEALVVRFQEQGEEALADEAARARLGAAAAAAVVRGSARTSIHSQQFLSTFATIATARMVLPVGLVPTANASNAQALAGFFAGALGPIEEVEGGVRFETAEGIVTRTRGVTTITMTDAQRAEALADANRRIRDEQTAATIARRKARKIAAAEVADAGRRALGDAMAQTPGVEGWTRGTSSASCDTCQGLADGTVLPPTVQMITHPACDCVQRPVLTTGATR